MNQMIDELINTSTEATDILIDDVVDNEIVQKLPVIGWCFRLLKIGKSISDIIFLNKLKLFITNINSEKIDKNWKEKFSDEKECVKIARKIIFIIDSINEEKKIKYLAKIFCDYINGIISKGEFNLYIEIIQNVYTTLLEKIINFDEGHIYTELTVEDADQAAFCHLQSNLFFEPTSGTINDGLPYKLNKIGKYFKNIVGETEK